MNRAFERFFSFFVIYFVIGDCLIGFPLSSHYFLIYDFKIQNVIVHLFKQKFICKN